MWTSKRMKWLKEETGFILLMVVCLFFFFFLSFGLCGLGRQKLTSLHPVQVSFPLLVGQQVSLLSM